MLLDHSLINPIKPAPIVAAVSCLPPATLFDEGGCFISSEEAIAAGNVVLVDVDVYTVTENLFSHFGALSSFLSLFLYFC